MRDVELEPAQSRGQAAEGMPIDVLERDPDDGIAHRSHYLVLHLEGGSGAVDEWLVRLAPVVPYHDGTDADRRAGIEGRSCFCGGCPRLHGLQVLLDDGLGLALRPDCAPVHPDDAVAV